MDIVKSDIVSLHGAVISMIGGRPENQDDFAYLDTPLGFLAIVCDGMGGGPGGKTASYIAKYEISKALCESNLQMPRDHALRMAVTHAHETIMQKMTVTPNLNGMGSTVVAVLINKQSAVIAHAGDSRCYLFRGKKCLYRSQDHSLVAELVKKKVMTDEEARISPQSNVITRGLGCVKNHVPEIDEIPYKKGDRFVLCTDGVWGSMPHNELLRILALPIDQQRLLSDLSAQIDNIGFSKGGGHDNYTIAMFEMEKASEMSGNMSWKKTVLLASALGLVLVLACICLSALFRSCESKNSQTVQTEVNVSTEGYLSGDIPKSVSISDKGVMDKPSTDSDEDGSEKENGNENGLIGDSETREAILAKINELRRDSDGIANKQEPKPGMEEVTPNSVKTIQSIIEKYESVKSVADKDMNKAQQRIKNEKSEILKLFEDLCEQTKTDSVIHEKVKKISNVIDAPNSWDIDVKNKEGEHTLTAKAKRLINKQIARLGELKEAIEQKHKKK